VKLVVHDERWPLAHAFTISRGSKTEAHVVVVELSDGVATGRGECVPYARYGETVEGVIGQIEAVRDVIEAKITKQALSELLPPGAARNAVDCALWDWEAKSTGVRAFERAGRVRLDPVKTCYTISLASPDEMAEQARAASRRPMLKLKIGGPDDLACVEAVRAAAPLARLVVDANEGLSFDALVRMAPDLARLDVKLVEQPLKAADDEALAGYDCPVMLCADESLHAPSDLARCARLYGAVNIKLDKTGGLTEGLRLTAQARALGLEIMAGCMVATSLAMAPALIIAQGAAFVDLDGPLLLAHDRRLGLRFEGSIIFPPEPELWG
jgi:L-alanine-DL-glutamate epimerase-like enolase superfamily enzyme